MPLRKPRPEGAQPLYEVRLALNMTQPELARAAHTDQPTISRLESGDKMPTRAILARLVRITKRRPEDLFTKPVLDELERRYRAQQTKAVAAR